MEKMKIEVWSDVMCPFCYIGKRKLEKSLQAFPNKDLIEIEWKSYQLNPGLKTDTSITIDDYLAIHKGMPLEQARQLNDQVTEIAEQEGLVYNLDRAVVANSFKAHILAHFAKRSGKQQEVEELLFKSYFTEGKNIDDMDVLKEIAESQGLDRGQFENIVKTGELDDEVKMDIHEAKQVGVKGVPFFVYDRKYAISGAQPQELFERTLLQSMEEWKSSSVLKVVDNNEGASCGPDGCD